MREMKLWKCETDISDPPKFARDAVLCKGRYATNFWIYPVIWIFPEEAIDDNGVDHLFLPTVGEDGMAEMHSASTP